MDNRKHNHTIYTFINITTRETFTGTIKELSVKSNLGSTGILSVIDGKSKRCGEWTLPHYLSHYNQSTFKLTPKTKDIIPNNPSIPSTDEEWNKLNSIVNNDSPAPLLTPQTNENKQYVFLNKLLHRKFSGTKNDFLLKYPIYAPETLDRLISGLQLSMDGWKVFFRKAYSPIEYNFINIKTNERITCTQVTLRLTYGLNRNSVSKMINRGYKTIKGWTLEGRDLTRKTITTKRVLTEEQKQHLREQSKAYYSKHPDCHKGEKNPMYNHKEYEFVNKFTNEEIKCTPYQLANQFNLDSRYISRIVNGYCKTCKGWYIKGTDLTFKRKIIVLPNSSSLCNVQETSSNSSSLFNPVTSSISYELQASYSGSFIPFVQDI